MTSSGSYQLVIIGDNSEPRLDGLSRRLGVALETALNQLGLEAKKFLEKINSGAAGVSLDRKMPTVGVFFGLRPAPMMPAIDEARLKQMLSDGILIIPVVEEISRFGEFVPPEIAHLHGVTLTDCGADFERLAARVLEGLGLLRETRRIFISYRRVETSGVASQLYESLDESGFDVFLDTHGVLRPGEPFQDVLWHRLADTDVAVVLDSPGFLTSRWTEEELARANTSNIQILQVLWPGREDAAMAAFSTFHPLTTDDFEDTITLGASARLRAQAANEIVDAVERLRARAIGAGKTLPEAVG